MGSLGSNSAEKSSMDSDDVPRPAFNINRIVIIGAGPSGLAAAKYLLAEGFTSSQIDIYEQQAEVGGVWNYNDVTPSQPPCVPQTDAHVAPDPPIYPPSTADEEDDYELDSDEEACTAPGSGACSLPSVSRKEKKPPVFPNPMYDDLHANIPHPLMRYSDLGFMSDEKVKGTHDDCDFFPSRQVVLEYLRQYARDVRHLITFSTQVIDVSLLPSASAGDDAPARIQDKWTVRSTNLLTGVSRTGFYDAVVVASGHYSTTFIPASARDIAAFASAHPGVISHSKTYRTASAFAGKRVVVVGAGPSGVDIASQISRVCASPLLVSTRSPLSADVSELIGVSDKVRVVGEIERFLIDERGVKVRSSTAEGSGVEKITDVDAVVFCTGYLYSFPFLSPASLPSSTPPLVTAGRRVHCVARHFIHTHHPTLVFPGLPMKVIPFPLAEAQAALFSRLWSNRLPLPSHEELRELEREDEEGKGLEGERVVVDGKPFHLFPKGGDARYINALHEWAIQAKGEGAGKGKEPPFWGPKELWRRSIYIDVRLEYLRTGCKAKSWRELGFVYEAGI